MKNLVEWIEEAEYDEPLLVARAVTIALVAIMVVTSLCMLTAAVPYFWIVWPLAFVCGFCLLIKYAMRDPIK
jgi:hypothetical protein